MNRQRKKPEEKAPNKTQEAPKSQEDILAAICRKVEGAELLSDGDQEEIGFTSTTSLALNYICSGKFVGGGVPKGRVTEIFGPSSAAKTVIGTHILQGCQKEGGVAVLLDSENAYSPSFARVLGLDLNRLIYLKPEHLEACFAKVAEIAVLVGQKQTKTPLCVVYDSIAASPSMREYNELMENKPSAPEMGERARICSRELRKIASYLNRLNCSLIVINQIRSKIGVLYGNPETTAGGGNSLEYYCSVRLDCRRQDILQDSRKRPIGILLRVKAVKNKVTSPFKTARALRLYWDLGIDPCSGLLDILLDTDKIKPGAPGWYHLCSDESVKFQAKKEDNYVPKKFLLEHPEVLNTTRDQLEEFLGYNKSALEVSESSEILPGGAGDAEEPEDKE